MTLIAFPLEITHTKTESLVHDQRGVLVFRGPDMLVIDMVVGILNAPYTEPSRTRGRKKPQMEKDHAE